MRLSTAPTPLHFPSELEQEIRHCMDAEFSHGLNFYLSNYPFYAQLTP